MSSPLGKYGDILLKGMVSQYAPSIAQGILVELLRKRKVDVHVVSEWVKTDRSLWDELEPAEQDGLRRLATKVSDVSWMTADWAIDALRKDFPTVASLFLGWVKARNWLGRQIEILKREATK